MVKFGGWSDATRGFVLRPDPFHLEFPLIFRTQWEAEVVEPGTKVGEGVTPLDQFIDSLQQLRADSGSPSYSQIALRIAQSRRAEGMTPEAARLGKTTVYDAFQPGRRRLNSALVVEIVRALGLCHEDAARWGQACGRAQQGHEVSLARLTNVADVSVQEAESPVLDHASMLLRKEATSGFARWAAPILNPVLVLLLGCVVLNLFGGWLVMAARLPLFLDMAGTGIAAVVLGPWYGALVAVLTNFGEVPVDGRASIPFVIVNVAGALVWGYGVRRYQLGRSIPRFFLLNLLVGVVCTVVAAPILVTLFGGMTRNASADQTEAVRQFLHNLVDAVLWSNLLTSLEDKMISGFVLLLVVSVLPAALARRLPESWRLTPVHRLALALEVRRMFEPVAA